MSVESWSIRMVLIRDSVIQVLQQFQIKLISPFSWFIARLTKYSFNLKITKPAVLTKNLGKSPDSALASDWSE